jgi:ankyrin repeat protein
MQSANSVIDILNSGCYDDDESKLFFEDNPDLVQDAFTSLLKDGNWNYAKLLNEITHDELHELFDQFYLDMCLNNYPDAAKWLFQQKPNLKQAIHIACEYGHFELAKFIHSQIGTVFDCGALLMSTAMNGHMEIAEWLVATNELPASKNNINTAFRMACINGHIVIARWLITIYPNTDIHSNDNYAFKGACERGYLDVAKWLFQHINNMPGSHISTDTFEYVIKGACENGHFEIAQWLFSITSVSSIATEYAFRVACAGGYLEIAKWLLTRNPDIEIAACDNYAFEYACQNGHLDVVEWIIGLSSGLRFQIHNSTFVKICGYGHQEIAQVVVKYRFEIIIASSELNASAVHYHLTHAECFYIIEHAFQEACRNGKLDTVLWMLSTFPELHESIDEYAFGLACFNGQLPMAKWLLQKKPEINIFEKKLTNYGKIFLFQIACMNGFLEMAKWLFMVSGYSFNISFENEFAFRHACKNGHYDVANWLLSMKPTIDIGSMNYWAFKSVSKNGNMLMVKWLFSLDPTGVIQSIDNRLLEKVCERGFFMIAKWLHAKKQTLTVSSQTFHLVCVQGHTEIAKWLVSKHFNMNVVSVATVELSFRGACYRGHLDTAKWLLSIQPNMNPSVVDSVFLRACDFNYLPTATWLSNLNSKYVVETDDDENIIHYLIKRELPIIKNEQQRRRNGGLDAENEDNICPICLENPVSMQTNCLHKYCRQCLITHYYYNITCPLCRTEITVCYELNMEYV